MITSHWTPNILLLTFCWGSVGLVWIAAGLLADAHPISSRQRPPKAPIWLLSIAITWGLDRFVPGTVWAALTWSPAWLHLIGLCLLIPATVFTLWARAALGRMWSDGVSVRGERVLHTDGPYRVTRHPIYTGILGMLLGSLLLNGFGIWLLLSLSGATVIVAKIPAEERHLRESFGGRYADYQRSVPAIVPGFHPPRRD